MRSMVEGARASQRRCRRKVERGDTEITLKRRSRVEFRAPSTTLRVVPLPR